MGEGSPTLGMKAGFSWEAAFECCLTIRIPIQCLQKKLTVTILDVFRQVMVEIRVDNHLICLLMLGIHAWTAVIAPPSAQLPLPFPFN